MEKDAEKAVEKIIETDGDRNIGTTVRMIMKIVSQARSEGYEEGVLSVGTTCIEKEESYQIGWNEAIAEAVKVAKEVITESVPSGCTDGIEGCLVMHYEPRKRHLTAKEIAEKLSALVKK